MNEYLAGFRQSYSFSAISHNVQETDQFFKFVLKQQIYAQMHIETKKQ